MQQNPNANYKRLYEQTKQLTKKQQQHILKLQQQIRQRCQSYLIQQQNRGSSNRTIKSHIRNIQNHQENSGVKSWIGDSNNAENSFVRPLSSENYIRQRHLNMQKNILNQKIVGNYGISSIGKNDKIQVKQKQSNHQQTLKQANQIIHITTNFDSENQAISSLKDRIAKIHTQKNDYVKQAKRLKQQLSKKDKQIIALKDQVDEQGRSSTRVNRDLDELQKYKRAFSLMQSEISSIMNVNQLSASQQKQGNFQRDPVSKMKSYIEKIKQKIIKNEKFLSELSQGSLLCYSQTAYQPQQKSKCNRQSGQDDIFPLNCEKNGDQIMKKTMNHVLTQGMGQSQNLHKKPFLNVTRSINANICNQNQQTGFSVASSPREPLNIDIFTNSMRTVRKPKSDDQNQGQKSPSKSLSKLKSRTLSRQNAPISQQAKQDVQNLKEIIEKYEFQIKLLKKQAQSKLILQTEVDKLQKEVRSLKYDLNDKQSQLQLLNSIKNDKNSNDSESALKNSIQYTKQDQKIAQELRLLRNAQEQLKQKNQILQNELISLTNQLKQLHLKEVSSKTHNITLQKQNESLRNQLKQLIKQYESAKLMKQETKQLNIQGQKAFNLKSLSPERPRQIYNQRYEDLVLQREELVQENRTLRQKLEFQITNRNQAPHDPDLSPYYIEQDIQNINETEQYVKRRFRRKKVVRRNLSAMTFKSTNKGKKQTVEHLKKQLERLKTAHGKNSEQNIHIKKFANKIAKLQQGLQTSDKISEASHQSTQYNKNLNNNHNGQKQVNRNSGVTDDLTISSSNNDMQDRVHIFQLMTETPNKVISSSKIFESLNRKKQRQQQLAQKQRQNRFNFIRKGKTESSGIL